MYNFQLVNIDTDALSFCKQTGESFSLEERDILLKELNSFMPKKISWEDDGYYHSVLVVKAKNYVTKDEQGKIKIRGSGLKGSMKEKALQAFMKEVINLLLDNKKDEVINVYNNYVKEIYNLTDIANWCSKKTITKSILNPERANEQKVLDSLEGEDFQEGEKIYVYFKWDSTIGLQNKWNSAAPDHDVYKLLKKLHKTICIFANVLDKKQFINYSLKTKRSLLEAFK